MQQKSPQYLCKFRGCHHKPIRTEAGLLRHYKAEHAAETIRRLEQREDRVARIQEDMATGLEGIVDIQDSLLLIPPQLFEVHQAKGVVDQAATVPPVTQAWHGEYLFQKPVQHIKENIKWLLQIFELVPNFVSPFVNREQIYPKISSTAAPPIPWHKTSISIEKLPTVPKVPPSWKKDLDFHFRDVIDIVQALYGNPTFVNDMAHAPVIELDHNGNRIFQNRSLEHGGGKNELTIIVLCFSSDKTVVSVQKGLRLLNHSTELRMETSRGVNQLVGLIPIPKAPSSEKKTPLYQQFLREVFHECMRFLFWRLLQDSVTGRLMLGPDGLTRKVVLGLPSWMADYLDQILLAGIIYGHCAVCFRDHNSLELPGIGPFHTGRHSNMLRTTLSKTHLAKSELPSGLEILGDPHCMLTLDRLHRNDKPYLDHVVNCGRSKSGIEEGQDEMERRLKLVPPFSGCHYFGNGLDFNRWTGSDAHQLRKIFMAILYNLGLPDDILNMHRLEANIGLLIQFRRHDEQSLQELRENLDSYYRFRKVFDTVRGSDKGKFLGYKLPLKHAREHWPDFICSLGNLVGLSTDLSEHLHIVFVKIPYRRTNRQDVERQICAMSD
ncbi:hypothetical protein BT69DRAFT_1298254 [Atractiella rhizophila]|nr:hypothetical protein BT69DRAFT_1298254 [Atractiella rhizophila]